MKKKNYHIISVENLAKESHVISETSGLVVSKNATKIEEYLLHAEYPHLVEGILIVCCLKGTAKVRVNLTEYDIAENTVAVAVPNYVIQLLEHSEDLQLEFLFFSFDFISDIGLLTEIGEIGKIVEERPCLYLYREDFMELLNIHGVIVRQHQKKRAYRREIIQNLLYALCYQILQLYTTKEVNRADKKLIRGEEIFKKFMSLLFEYYKTERSVQFYAEKLNITPKYLSKVIRETSFKPPSDLIDEMVITAAKALLKSSNLTVAQIADELNFANPSFFGAYFKKRVGMTPLEYREK